MNKYLEKIAARVSKLSKTVQTGVDLEAFRQRSRKKKANKKKEPRMFSRRSARNS